MGIKERHERDREAVRRAILDAARDLFVVEGFPHVSIRKIAERIEYSPAAIYSYFPSKDDIFFALAEEGFRLLGDPRDDERRQNELSALSPLDRVRAMFWRLYEFSREQPQYFALMFIERSVPRINREYERFAFARTMKQHLVEEIEACIAAGELPATTRPFVAVRLLTAGVLGVASMRLTERLAAGEDADTLAADAIDVALAGIRSGILLRSTDTAFCSASEDADVAPGHQSDTAARAPEAPVRASREPALAPQTPSHVAQAFRPAGQEPR
jgi:AcrR family transcriptional regulator